VPDELPIFGSPRWRISGSNWSQPTSDVRAIYKLHRNLIANRTVWSDLIIVLTPNLQFFGRIVKAYELVRIQTFRSQLAVERLDKGIVCRLVGREKSRIMSY